MPLPKQVIVDTLKTISGKRVAVVGDFMLDRYIWGAVRRISPEAPVPVVEVSEESERPGGAGNVVTNLLRLGAGCEAVGLIGDDSNGVILKELLESQGTNTRGMVRTSDRPTTAKTRIFAEEQQVVRVDRERNAWVTDELQKTVAERVHEAIDAADAVILQDYNKGVLTPTIIRTAINAAQKKGIPITVDPKTDHFFEYIGATIFKPNLREAETALGRRLPDNKEVERGGNELLVRLQAEMVLLTRGAQGMTLFTHGDSPKHIPTKARSIADVSGAGDTVISTLTLGLVAGLSGYESAQLATKAAGYVVSQVGVVPITPEALLTESGD